ncbi:hypothetical protein D3C86_1898940 [compost metagenome]
MAMAPQLPAPPFLTLSASLAGAVLSFLYFLETASKLGPSFLGSESLKEWQARQSLCFIRSRPLPAA